MHDGYSRIIIICISSPTSPEKTTEINVTITAVVMIVLFIASASAQVLKHFVGENIPLAVEEISSSLQSAAAFIVSESQR